MTAPVIAAVFTTGYLALTAWLCRGLRLTARSLAHGGRICAVTLALSAVYIPLPTGASISAGSMLPLMLLALLDDPRLAFLTGWATGLLALILLPLWAPVHWAQVFVEHLTAFSCLGYAGIFGSDERWKVPAGALLAFFLRFTGQVLSGVVFFAQNAWDGWGAWGYSLSYHLSSKVPEGLLTIAVLLALPLERLRRAIKKGEER